MATEETRLADLDARARAIGRILLRRGERVALAETSTGGLIGAVLARQPDAERWFAGSIVAYAQSVQTGLLGLPPDLIAAAGIVSPDVSRYLAAAVAERFGVTWGVAETGIAGPQTGRRSAKPAGLAYLAVHGGNQREREMRTGHDRRVANKAAFAGAALELLRACLDVA